MDQRQRLAVFRAQTSNVRELTATWAHVKRSIHAQLLTGNTKSVELQTKLLALTYCAWLEALFSKVIHTPHGFSLDEIAQIKREGQASGISAAWKKCVQLALRRVRAAKTGHVANVSRQLNRLIAEYVEAPSLLRNKVAHGQIVLALNRGNTDVNADLTAQLQDVDLVKLDRWRAASQGMADIVENIIESPRKGAMRDYWTLMQRVLDKLETSRGYTLADKVELLKAKKAARRHAVATANSTDALIPSDATRADASSTRPTAR